MASASTAWAAVLVGMAAVVVDMNKAAAKRMRVVEAAIVRQSRSEAVECRDIYRRTSTGLRGNCFAVARHGLGLFHMVIG